MREPTLAETRTLDGGFGGPPISAKRRAAEPGLSGGTKVELFPPGDGKDDQSMNKGHVLIVEDEFLIRLLLVDALSDAGFTVAEARNGDLAIEMLDQPKAFDLVVTDISMPGGTDGNAVATKAKQVHPGMPVIYASGRPESLTNVVGFGDAFLPKPYSPTELVATVDRLLKLT
jgi:DNA-binding NtrC family response regulator